MNCLAFRRMQNTVPGTHDPEFHRHRRECPACAAMAARAARFQQNLKDALKLDAPHEFGARILLRQSFHQRRRDKRRRQGLYGLAASVFLALGLVGGFFLPRPAPSLEQAIVRHVTEEPHDELTAYRIHPEFLAALLRPVGVSLEGAFIKVTGARLCAVNRKVAAHLIIEGTKAPVVVLLMPESPVQSRSRIRRGDLDGFVVPARTGSVAIIGQRGEPLESIENQVRAALRWTT